MCTPWKTIPDREQMQGPWQESAQQDLRSSGEDSVVEGEWAGIQARSEGQQKTLHLTLNKMGKYGRGLSEEETWSGQYFKDLFRLLSWEAIAEKKAKVWKNGSEASALLQTNNDDSFDQVARGDQIHDYVFERRAKRICWEIGWKVCEKHSAARPMTQATRKPPI